MVQPEYATSLPYASGRKKIGIVCESPTRYTGKQKVCGVPGKDTTHLPGSWYMCFPFPKIRNWADKVLTPVKRTFTGGVVVSSYTQRPDAIAKNLRQAGSEMLVLKNIKTKKNRHKRSTHTCPSLKYGLVPTPFQNAPLRYYGRHKRFRLYPSVRKS